MSHYRSSGVFCSGFTWLKLSAEKSLFFTKFLKKSMKKKQSTLSYRSSKIHFWSLTEGVNKKEYRGRLCFFLLYCGGHNFVFIYGFPYFNKKTKNVLTLNIEWKIIVICHSFFLFLIESFHFCLKKFPFASFLNIL